MKTGPLVANLLSKEKNYPILLSGGFAMKKKTIFALTASFSIIGMVAAESTVQAAGLELTSVTNFFGFNFTSAGFFGSFIAASLALFYGYYRQPASDFDALTSSIDEFAMSSRVWNSNAYPEGFAELAKTDPEGTWQRYQPAWETRPEMFAENGRKIMAQLESNFS